MILSMRQITNMEHLTTDVLLFGTEAVSDEINTSILKAVQKYMKLSKPFSHLVQQNDVDTVRYFFLDIETHDKHIFCCFYFVY